MIKVSIIIPVYNSEEYIVGCIKSLLRQSLQECQFIFVNDGSVDNSQQIIEKYRRNDPRIILVNQENQGVSSARNKGLEVATGEFVGFVDADDYIEPNMYMNLYQTALKSNSDIIISNLESEIDGQIVITKYPFPKNIPLDKDYIKNEIFPYFIESDNLNSVCNKLYKCKVIKDNEINFPEKIALGEDGLFNINFISNIDTMIYIDYTGYHYREVKGSATRNILDKDYFERAIEVYKLLLPETLTGNMDQVKIQQLKSIKLVKTVISYIHIYLTAVKDLSFKKRILYIKKMIRNQYVEESIPIFYREFNDSMGIYERFIITMMKRKSALGLYLAATYSRVRNK